MYVLAGVDVVVVGLGKATVLMVPSELDRPSAIVLDRALRWGEVAPNVRRVVILALSASCLPPVTALLIHVLEPSLAQSVQHVSVHFARAIKIVWLIASLVCHVGKQSR